MCHKTDKYRKLRGPKEHMIQTQIIASYRKRVDKWVVDSRRGSERMFREAGTACAKARKSNGVWSYWNSEHSSVCLVPDRRNPAHPINSRVFISEAMGSHRKYFRHSGDMNLWNFKQFILTTLIIGLLTTDVKWLHLPHCIFVIGWRLDEVMYLKVLCKSLSTWQTEGRVINHYVNIVISTLRLLCLYQFL